MELRVIRRSGKWIQTDCPYCGCDDLWLDTSTGAGHCFQCGTHTGLGKLQKQFGLECSCTPARSIRKEEPVCDVQGACRYLTAIWPELPYRAKREHIDAERFRLAMTDDLRQRMERDLSDKQMTEFGFRYWRDGEYRWSRALARRRIVIPYFRAGGLVNLRTRGTGVRYLQIRGWRSTFWGERSQPEVVLTEGEFKAMRLEQLGYNALAIPGITSCHDEVVRYLQCQQVRAVIVWFDSENDPTHAVYEQQQRLLRKLSAAGIVARAACPVPPGLVNRKVDVEDVVTWMGDSWVSEYLGLLFAATSADPPVSGTVPLSLSPPDDAPAPPPARC